MKAKKGRLYTILIHAVLWAVFATLPAMVMPRPRFIPEGVPTWLLLLFLVVTTLPLMGLFYVQVHYILPRFYLRKRYLWLAGLTLGGIVGMMGISLLLFHGFQWVQTLFDHQSTFLMRGSAYRTIVVVLLSFGLFTYQRWRLAETGKAEAELAYLKAQINPHFLFNTLNSIYYLTLQQSERAPQAVEKLSAIMRYVIDEGNLDWVPLEREVAYLSDYIALQRLRFAENVHIDLQVQGDLQGKQIAPLLLVSFVENAFKHGISMEEDSPIAVGIEVGANKMKFRVHNRKFGGQAQAEPGIGLENTRRRLEIAYPAQYTLAVTETATDYAVTLTLPFL